MIATYAKKLLGMGYDMTVVSRGPGKLKTRDQLSYLLRHRRFSRRDPNQAVYFDALGDRHLEIVRDGPLLAQDVPDGDIVIATWWRTAFEVAALPAEKGTKVYFVQHHEVHDHLPWDLSAGSYYLPLQKITISRWLVEQMAQYYGDLDLPMVPNSVDTELFYAPARSLNTRPTVGFIYSPAKFKGVDVTLKAIEIVHQSFPDLRVVTFGQHDISNDLTLPDYSTFSRTPKQEELRTIYASCDVWLSGSRAEGFGLPILEAMACRTPVIATRTGASCDLIMDGINGYVVDIENAEEMASRVVEILSASPSTWQKMSDAAFITAHSYSWDDAARAFAAELEKLHDKRQPVNSKD